MLTGITFAGLAGILSVLSPCVLPLVPIVLASAANRHRLGPLALAAGLAVSFVVVGLFVALVGFGLGLDFGLFRSAGAIIMILIGAVMVMPALQARLALAAGPVGSWTEKRFGGFDESGWQGQFGVGLLLGTVWSPCIGPTLGAASLMAARGENLGQVIVTMLAFGIGAALPLLVLGTVSRDLFSRTRDRMLRAGRWLKAILGIMLIVIGSLILTGMDKRLETKLIEASPAWLTDLTTRF
ncbi:cytochrome c biogenesis CcdA family protein [Rhizobium lemnae]|uniref:Cytochrome c biogenesis CcdA family protein n=1 Tax=Rhizobium lemnae TaxID=1214924 RepID=A0ABV8E8L6_9HYPH|nr:cytochrome c biogenesis CcdA family protein [Rhizobium lemnae]MCJ8508323.1 cytochrome c biogenesis CcdA family protein [Rhizobium lemnae]